MVNWLTKMLVNHDNRPPASVNNPQILISLLTTHVAFSFQNDIHCYNLDYE